MPDDHRLATLITAREHLEEVCAELAKCPRLAFDTESNGFYAYKEKVCLVQISSPTEDFIVDPIAISNLDVLGPLLADPNIEKLFHAGEYDVLCLKRAANTRCPGTWETVHGHIAEGEKPVDAARLGKRRCIQFLGGQFGHQGPQDRRPQGNGPQIARVRHGCQEKWPRRTRPLSAPRHGRTTDR